MRGRCGLVMLVLAAGCAEEDLPYRGAGGGGSGHNDPGPDASPADPDGTPSMTLTGEVCVIVDWSAPFACADLALSHQVEVADTALGGAVTTSDNSGQFTLALSGTSAVIRVGGEVGDLLESTQSFQIGALSPVKAPVVDESLWDATLASLLETQTTGAGVVYVVDPAGPVAGATITFTTAVNPAARIIYDDGAGSFDTNAVDTGPDGSALLLDILNVGVRADTDDGRSGSVFVDTASGEVGITTITLPAL